MEKTLDIGIQNIGVNIEKLIKDNKRLKIKYKLKGGDYIITSYKIDYKSYDKIVDDIMKYYYSVNDGYIEFTSLKDKRSTRITHTHFGINCENFKVQVSEDSKFCEDIDFTRILLNTVIFELFYPICWLKRLNEIKDKKD